MTPELRFLGGSLELWLRASANLAAAAVMWALHLFLSLWVNDAPEEAEPADADPTVEVWITPDQVKAEYPEGVGRVIR